VVAVKFLCLGGAVVLAVNCYRLHFAVTALAEIATAAVCGNLTETFSNNIEYNFTYLAATANAALQGQSPAVLAGMPVGPGVSPQPGFFGRGGVWLPVVIQLPTGQAKSI